MRAIVQHRFGGPEVLECTELPAPTPGSGEILIRVVAAGVNPVDRAIREGGVPASLSHHFPIVPGFEVAGLVEALGPGTGRFRKGDRVWATILGATVQHGGYAELVAVPEDQAAAMPPGLLYEEAAAVPLACAAACRTIMGDGAFADGARVVIQDAAGGIGRIAVQIARHAGATVIAIASRKDHPRLAELRADHMIAIEDGDIREAMRRIAPDGIDVLFDPGVFPVEPYGNTLERVADLVKRGALNPRVDRIVPLADAAIAQEACGDAYSGVKVVLAL